MRLLSLALLLALAAPQTHAQIIPSLDLGVAGGVNFGTLGDATGLELGNSTGYHVGLYADVGVLFFSARTGLYYLRAGDIRTEGGNGTELTSVNFVTVPVDFQLQTPTPILKAYALAGPEFRFQVDGADTFDRRTMNTAINVGVGAKGGVPLIGPSGFLELRYAFDVTGIRDNEASDETYKVSLFMVRAGVGI